MNLFKIYILVKGQEEEVLLQLPKECDKEEKFVKRDILDAIKQAETFEMFKTFIEKRGYECCSCKEIEFEEGLFIGDFLVK